MDLRCQQRHYELQPHGRLPWAALCRGISTRGASRKKKPCRPCCISISTLKEINKIHDCRVIIGGVGKHRKEADRLAIVIMELPAASARLCHSSPCAITATWTRTVFPQGDGGVNAEGTTFPIIYSDETNVPAVEKVFGVSHEEAEQYVPFGCGEYVIVGYSVGTPNNGINALKALEVRCTTALISTRTFPAAKKDRRPGAV